MNTQDQDQIRWQLQALRRDIEPETDLWPGIAARLAEAAPRQQVPAASSPRRRFAPWALAASVLLAVGFVWQLGQTPEAQIPQGNPLIRQQAVAMTLDYERELALAGEAQTHPEIHAALEDLDRSASLILSAIDHEPNARFLLDQLRRTYARRLQLTQRALIT